MSLLRRPRPGEWSRLSSLSALRFLTAGRVKASLPVAFTRPWLLWLAAWLDLASGVAWTTGDGHAMAMLVGPQLGKPWRQMLVVAGVVVAGAALLVAVASQAPLSVTVLLGVPVCVVLGWTAGASVRVWWDSRALRRLRPQGSYFLYGLVASREVPGAGQCLVKALGAEADDHDWVLYLEAPGDMPGYYDRLDFSPVAPGQLMAWGEMLTVMVREPRSVRGSSLA